MAATSPMPAPRSMRAPTIPFRPHRRCGTDPLGHDFRRRVYDLAPSRRFYSGGGGSVRGYGYQQLGPKDMDGDPIGGRGLAEFAVEARIRLKQFGGNFGIVPFFDGGSLSTGEWPDFGGLALRGRTWPRVTIRASAPSASTSASRSIASRATVPWPSLCRSARPSSDGRGRLGQPRVGTAAPAPTRRLGAPPAQRAAGALRRAAVPAGRRAGAARHGAWPPFHRRPDRGAGNRLGAEDPHWAHRRFDFRPVAAAQRRRLGHARRVPDLAQHQARLVARLMAQPQTQHRQPDRRARHAHSPAQDQAELEKRADPSRL